MDAFETAHNFTARWEGGWSNHKDDPGGATMLGVTQRTYDRWRVSRGLPTRSVRHITKPEALAIYREDYWQPVRGAELPVPLAIVVYDIAVNAGPGRAIRMLQAAVGAGVDGQFGPRTLAAMRARYERSPRRVIYELGLRRLLHWSSLRHFATFRDGWFRRGLDLMIEAGQLLKAEQNRRLSLSVGSGGIAHDQRT
ncbi:MAG: glycosyl hydrolase 108 family protein [Pseudomonadota bacterium]